MSTTITNDELAAHVPVLTYYRLNIVCKVLQALAPLAQSRAQGSFAQYAKPSAGKFTKLMFPIRGSGLCWSPDTVTRARLLEGNLDKDPTQPWCEKR